MVPVSDAADRGLPRYTRGRLRASEHVLRGPSTLCSSPRLLVLLADVGQPALGSFSARDGVGDAAIHSGELRYQLPVTLLRTVECRLQRRDLRKCFSKISHDRREIGTDL